MGVWGKQSRTYTFPKAESNLHTKGWKDGKNIFKVHKVTHVGPEYKQKAK